MKFSEALAQEETMPTLESQNSGIIERTLHLIRCPACGRFVHAVAYGGVIRGFCAIVGTKVNISVKSVLPVPQHDEKDA